MSIYKMIKNKGEIFTYKLYFSYGENKLGFGGANG